MRKEIMNPEENKSTTFSTDSLPLAALLLAKSCELLSIDKTSRRATFIFKESEELQSLTREFWRWKANVEPREFFAKQKELKNMLFSSSYPTQQVGK